MSDALTIRTFVPDCDLEGVRVVDRMNWTGAGIAFPRSEWPKVKQRGVFDGPNLSGTHRFALLRLPGLGWCWEVKQRVLPLAAAA